MVPFVRKLKVRALQPMPAPELVTEFEVRAFAFGTPTYEYKREPEGMVSVV